MKYNKIILILIILVISGFITKIYYPKLDLYIEIKNTEKTNEETINKIKENKKKDTKVSLEKYLEVDFICQAPLQTESNWALHEESCEEAAILQAYLYEKKEKRTKEEANIEILNMIDWQINNIGGHYDLYAEELKPMIIDYFNIKESHINIKFDASIDDIKNIISDGHPVIAPVTSEYLNNPYYPHPGYHMLTVTGFTEDRIITNDNGTKRGEDFSYSNLDFEKALMDAGADILYFDFNNG